MWGVYYYVLWNKNKGYKVEEKKTNEKNLHYSEIK